MISTRDDGFAVTDQALLKALLTSRIVIGQTNAMALSRPDGVVQESLDDSAHGGNAMILQAYAEQQRPAATCSALSQAMSSSLSWHAALHNILPDILP